MGSINKLNGNTTAFEWKPIAAGTKTDRSKWRLRDVQGRQTWHYLRTQKEIEAWPQTTADKYFQGLNTASPKLPSPQTPLDSVNNGLEFFERLQLDPGNWACEYGGPMFLLPGMVVTWYVVGYQVPEEYRIEIANYLYARQNKEDGGWGLHIEGESTVFGTLMNYVAMRLLGQDRDEPRMIKARNTLHKLGGATQGPHWAKFWLALLGVYKWEGVNPVPPELWLLPDWTPISPWRWWIHMRQVFLPMSYIWSTNYSHPEDPLTASLKHEIYPQAYLAINFAGHRNSISPKDNYHPKTSLLNSINWLLVNVHEPLTSGLLNLRKKGQEWTWWLIQAEDKNTDFACLGPVNAPMNTVATFLRNGKDISHTAVQQHLDRLYDFFWLSGEGMLCNGTNGVQTWDTAFLIQAVHFSGLSESPKWRPMLLKALEFLEDQQFAEDCEDREKCYRQQRKGAWGFSTKDQGYTVSDCTAEAVKSVMLLQSLPNSTFPQLISQRRIRDAIDVLLDMQNSTGGFGTYESRRGSAWLMEQLNAAEVFGRIMVEYDYPECTTAVVTALHMFTKHDPSYRPEDIRKVIGYALQYIHDSQDDNGSWYGSWGICFTYAAQFAMESLRVAGGETWANSETVQKGVKYLLDRQRSDGGWGESYKSCETGQWVDHPDGSQVVQTAWACIALMEADVPVDVDQASGVGMALKRGIRLIAQRQRDTGEWLQEGIEGVFNKSCMISYPNYKFIFTIKALGMYAQRTGNKPLF